MDKIPALLVIPVIIITIHHVFLGKGTVDAALSVLGAPWTIVLFLVFFFFSRQWNLGKEAFQIMVFASLIWTIGS